MQNAFSRDDLIVVLERFASDAVPALVLLLVEISGGIVKDRLDESANSGVMLRRRRSDELIVRDGQAPPHRDESLRDLIHQLLGFDTSVGGLERDLEAVLVHADQKMNVIAAKSAIARDRVGADFLERMTEMRIAIGVVDGGRNVELSQAIFLRSLRRGCVVRLVVHAAADLLLRYSTAYRWRPPVLLAIAALRR